MNTPARRYARLDAVGVLGAIRHTLEGRFAGLAQAPKPASALRRLLLALELRSKLEELLLLPALYDAGVIGRPAFDDFDAAIEQLRESSARLQEQPADGPEAAASLLRLEKAAGLHFERIDAAHQRSVQSGAVDDAALGDEMQALLERWRQEIAATGDIEDEERDPVGLPPR